MYPYRSENFEKRQHAKNCISAIVALSIIAVIAAIVAIYFGAIATNGVARLETAQSYLTSGVIRHAPYAAHLDSSAAPLGMTLPNDLSDYIGKQYAVYSTTAQPHTITIDGGVLTTTWDGVNTIATFGGAVADGLTFRVIAKNRIAILPPTNVAFS